MTRCADLADAVDAETRGASGLRLGLAELATYVDRASFGLPEPQRTEAAAALRRVWLRNRLPESVSSSVVRDVADHCDLDTIAALADLAAALQPVVCDDAPYVASARSML